MKSIKELKAEIKDLGPSCTGTTHVTHIHVKIEALKDVLKLIDERLTKLEKQIKILEKKLKPYDKILNVCCEVKKSKL